VPVTLLVGQFSGTPDDHSALLIDRLTHK